jgi:hypothetical protein
MFERGCDADCGVKKPHHKGNSRVRNRWNGAKKDKTDLALLQKCIQTRKKRAFRQGIALTQGESRFIVKVKFLHGSLTPH